MIECISNNNIKYLSSAYYVPDSDLNSLRTMTYLIYTATDEGAANIASSQRRRPQHRGGPEGHAEAPQLSEE